LGGHGIDFGGERVEGVSQGRSDGAERRQRGGEAWSQKATVDSG